MKEFLSYLILGTGPRPDDAEEIDADRPAPILGLVMALFVDVWRRFAWWAVRDEEPAGVPSSTLTWREVPRWTCAERRHASRLDVCAKTKLTPERAFGPIAARAHEDVGTLLDAVKASEVERERLRVARNTAEGARLRAEDLVDVEGDEALERRAAAQTAARGVVLLLGTIADQDRALGHALEASDPHKALRSFMAALPSTDMQRERGPIEDAFAKLDAAIDEHGGTVAIAAAAEELADVIRTRLGEVATFALAWRDIVSQRDGRAWAASSMVDHESIVPTAREVLAAVEKEVRAARDRHASPVPTIEERIAKESAEGTTSRLGAAICKAFRDVGEASLQAAKAPRHDDPADPSTCGRCSEVLGRPSPCALTHDIAPASEVPVFEWREVGLDVEPCGTADELRTPGYRALAAEIAASAAKPHEDVVLQALHVSSGAAAIGLETVASANTIEGRRRADTEALERAGDPLAKGARVRSSNGAPRGPERRRRGARRGLEAR